MPRSALPFLATVLALSLPISAANAHAALIKSSPKSGATISQSDLEFNLTFSEAIEPGFSAFKIESVDGSEAKISIAFDEDRRAVVLKLGNKLQPGKYRVHWKIVSVDTHRTEGELSFSVK